MLELPGIPGGGTAGTGGTGTGGGVTDGRRMVREELEELDLGEELKNRNRPPPPPSGDRVRVVVAVVVAVVVVVVVVEVEAGEGGRRGEEGSIIGCSTITMSDGKDGTGVKLKSAGMGGGGDPSMSQGGEDGVTGATCSDGSEDDNEWERDSRDVSDPEVGARRLLLLGRTGGGRETIVTVVSIANGAGGAGGVFPSRLGVVVVTVTSTSFTSFESSATGDSCNALGTSNGPMTIASTLFLDSVGSSSTTTLCRFKTAGATPKMSCNDTAGCRRAFGEININCALVNSASNSNVLDVSDKIEAVSAGDPGVRL